MLRECLLKSVVTAFVLVFQIFNSYTLATRHVNNVINSPPVDNPYNHVVNLDSEGRYILEWTVDWTLDRVMFKVIVQTTGYIGLGLSPRGRKVDSDIVVGGVDSSTGVPYLIDMHGSHSNQTIGRDSSQDYNLHYAFENKTHTVLHFSRKFDTCDTNDFKINDNSMTILWAIGENDNERLYHYNRRGGYKTYLLDPNWTPKLIQEAKRTGVGLNSALAQENVRVWTIKRKQRVPPLDTAYWCSFHKGPVLNKRHHLIGFDFRWEDDIQFQHTHHLLLFRCTPPENVDPVSFFDPFVRNETGEMCYFLARGHVGGMPTQYCSEIFYPYAIGSRLFFFPDHMGLSFGYSPHEYYVLQVHYDNPDRLTNLEYEINIDLYYTPNLRQNEAGVMTVGHQIPGSPSILVPPYSLDHKIYGHCGSQCTKEMMPTEGIKIIGVQQHTHNSGIRHRFQHFRGNVELPWIFNDDNYDNRFQPTRMTRDEVNVLPGDHLMTTCVYDNTWTNGSVVGGFSTRQEMCLVYIWYYNKMEYSICRSEIVQNTDYFERYLGMVGNVTWSEQHLEYVSMDEELPLSEAANRVEWTIRRRQQLQHDHQWLLQRNTCNSWSRIRAAVSNGENLNDTVLARAGYFVRYPGGDIKVYDPVENEQICKRRGKFGWGKAHITNRN